MDEVFGKENIRSEIIWRRSPSHNKLSKQFGPIHDTILFFAKSELTIFHPSVTPYTKAYISGEFRYQDGRGRYRLNEIMGAETRTGDSGRPWRGYDPTERGRHWAIPNSLRELSSKNLSGLSTQEQLDSLLADDLIVLSRTGRPKYKQYPGAGVPYQDIWAFQPGTAGALEGSSDSIDEDVKWLSNEDEKLGYPTQKPVGLLERIVKTSSNPGDVILDPFCGCGTTIHAAEKLGRQWIGIDVTHLAISLIEKRLKDAFPGIKFDVHGAPKDLEGARDLSNRDKYQFQWWAVSLVDAVPFGGKKKGADGGIDGHIFFRSGAKTVEKAIVSVKGGGVGVKDIRELIAVVDRERAKIGIYISLEPHTEPMKREAAGAGLYDGPTGKVPKIQLFTIEELFAGKKPQIPLMERGFKAAAREERDDQPELEI
jgi:site-specific DNA-methyltransferase (adenine-specific)